MGRFKAWLVSHYLPVWAKQTVLADNERLRANIRVLEDKLGRLRAYVDGLEAGIRAQRKIVIKNGEGVK